MPGVGRPRLGVLVAMVASAAAVILVIALAIAAFAGRGRDAGTAFNACISQTRFLVLVRHGSGSKVIEKIKDRARSAAPVAS